jgi:hypothetical protein
LKGTIRCGSILGRSSQLQARRFGQPKAIFGRFECGARDKCMQTNLIFSAESARGGNCGSSEERRA